MSSSTLLVLDLLYITSFSASSSSFPSRHLLVSDLLSLEQVPETGRWRFMDVSPKFEAAVRAFPVQTVHT